MSRIQVFSAARITGNAAWWTFVVAVLLNRGLNPWGWDLGWTAYTPLTDGAPRRYADYVPSFDSTVQLMGVVVFAAFSLVVASAVVEMAISRQWRAAVAVVIPFISMGMIGYAFGDIDRTVVWSPTVVLVFVLAAVAIRQVWMRRFAPTMVNER
ncbi:MULTISPECIES: hypothetical protein [unclassified Mycobacterium]|uniref:hypothetical protein n=1 Tax=unclassified Mycobacterium TaxID=2642494 RepID=UPI00099235C7|nr:MULTISPECIES: hypothetical protein [unclassified Mycobacterium]